MYFCFIPCSCHLIVFAQVEKENLLRGWEGGLQWYSGRARALLGVRLGRRPQFCHFLAV